MRNIVIALLVVLGLIWLFFSNIYLGNYKVELLEKSDSVAVKGITKHDIDVVDIKKLAQLLKVEYLEEIGKEEAPAPSAFDVIVELVVIYTSESNHKLRISTLIQNDKKQFDMVVGDKLYDYTLTVIEPNSAKLNNGEKNITLKMFKATTISVTDLPKEVSNSL